VVKFSLAVAVTVILMLAGDCVNALFLKLITRLPSQIMDIPYSFYTLSLQMLSTE
jgi:hypothetical protein